MDWFVHLIDSLGVAVAVMAVLGLALWRLALWAARVVVEPVVSSHVRLIDTLTQVIPEQSAKLDQLQSAIDRQTAVLERAITQNGKNS